MSVLRLERTNPGQTPWGGYAAWVEGVQIGECAFKSAPIDGRVEIAYHTFDGFEQRGFATEMARALVGIARAAQPGVVVIAQTLSEINASTKILTKIGFTCQGTIQHPEDGEVLEWHLQPEVPVTQ
jgi:RimJ/RimL family protein N-acetyltransferase